MFTKDGIKQKLGEANISLFLCKNLVNQPQKGETTHERIHKEIQTKSKK